jgi:hypothetical protein
VRQETIANVSNAADHGGTLHRGIT